jgi:hypothetical protein
VRPLRNPYSRAARRACHVVERDSPAECVWEPTVGVAVSCDAYQESAMRRKTAAKRTLIAPRGSKRYIRRDASGRIKKSVDVGKSLAADRRSKSKTVAKAGQGDRGDRPSAKRKVAKKATRRTSRR